MNLITNIATALLLFIAALIVVYASNDILITFVGLATAIVTAQFRIHAQIMGERDHE